MVNERLTSLQGNEEGLMELVDDLPREYRGTRRVYEAALKCQETPAPVAAPLQPPAPGIPTKNEFDSALYITGFTDASYCSKTDAMGWAFWAKYTLDGRTMTKRASGNGVAKNCTEAEVIALYHLSDWIRGELDVTDKVIVIQSDCVYALDKFKTEELMQAGATHVKLKHVKSHQGHSSKRSSVNTWCDKAAKSCMRKRRAELQQTNPITW